MYTREHKKYKWQESNLAFHGSDLEKKIKAAAAEGEPQWQNVGGKEELRVWRIEAFRVVPWPRKRYGEFYEGDSYVILRTFKPESQAKSSLLTFTFWIGKYSTADEYGTAAYKSVELDHKLGDAAVIRREMQGHETKRFRKLFPNGLSILRGGVESGFNHVEREEYTPRLLHIKGTSEAIVLDEVKMKRSKLNSGDVFVMDLGLQIYQWNGAQSNPHEKIKAQEFIRSLISHRNGKAKMTVLDEGSGDEQETNFWKHLPGKRKLFGITVGSITVQAAEDGGDDQSIKAFEPQLFRLGGYTSSAYKRIGKGGPFSRAKLADDDVFLLDDGFTCFVYVGKAASVSERGNSLSAAVEYLKVYSRPAILPIVRVPRPRAERLLQAFLRSRAICCGLRLHCKLVLTYE